MELLPTCLCGSDTHTSDVIHDIPVLKCSNCGIIRQSLEYTPDQYYNFYAEEYHEDFQTNRGTQTYQDRYDHDYQIAELRRRKYHSLVGGAGKRVLDIGSSNNAFVDCMNSHGYQAFGVELGTAGRNFPNTTFNQDFLSIGFPTKHFDMITLHDVFEHLIDPIMYLKELNRVLVDDGLLVLDLPNYFVEAGVHHWKRVEHLWFFDEHQVAELLKQHGYKVVEIDYPIPSKAVVYARKIPYQQQRKPVKLLLMSGMGDCYWVLVKLQSLIEKHNWGIPDVYVFDPCSSAHVRNKPRSEDFLTKIPFINYKGPGVHQWPPEFELFYTERMGSGRPGKDTLVWKHPLWDYDYVLNFNGILENGDSLETWGLENYNTNWDIPIYVPLEENRKEQEYKDRFGEFNIAYFNDKGFYKDWTKTLSPTELYAVFKEIYARTGRKTVLIGVEWDAPYQRQIKALDVDNILHYEVGETSVAEMFALMKAAKLVIGWASGSTIMATYWKTPTIMFWSDSIFKNIDFMWNAINPQAHNNWYWPVRVEHYNRTKLLDIACGV